MPLSDLLTSLDDRAARELAEVTAAHRAEAADIRAAAAREADEIRRSLVDRARQEATAEAADQVEEVTVRCRRQLDEALHAELDRLRSAAQQRVQDAAGTSEGHRATAALLAEALELLPDPTRIRVHAEHVAAAHEVVPDPSTAPTITADLGVLGAVVEDEHRRRVINTVDERLVAIWPRARVAVAGAWRSSR